MDLGTHNTKRQIFIVDIMLEKKISKLHLYLGVDSPDKKSVLDKCQSMKDCPAGQICEKYDNMKYTLDYMVEAEVLLGYSIAFKKLSTFIALLISSF